MKTIVAAMTVCLLVAPSANAQLGLVEKAYESMTFTTEFGVGVPMNDDIFQQDYKDALFGAQRVELYLYRGVSVYVKYDWQTFDVASVAAPGAAPIDASDWVYGVMIGAELNESGSVFGYLELGASASLSPTEGEEWEWQKGIAARCYLTSSKKTAVDLGLRFNNLGDSPKIEAFEPRIAFCVAPGKIN